MSAITLITDFINENIDVPNNKKLWAYNNVETPKDWYLIIDFTQVSYNRINEYTIETDIVVEITLFVFEDNDEVRMKEIYNRVINGFDLIYSKPIFGIEGNAKFEGNVTSVNFNKSYFPEQHSYDIDILFNIKETKL